MTHPTDQALRTQGPGEHVLESYRRQLNEQINRYKTAQSRKTQGERESLLGQIEGNLELLDLVVFELVRRAIREDHARYQAQIAAEQVQQEALQRAYVAAQAEKTDQTDGILVTTQRKVGIAIVAAMAFGWGLGLLLGLFGTLGALLVWP